MERIAIDMDGVMADTLSAELAWFRERHGYRWTAAELRGKELFEAVAAPEHVAEHQAMLREGSFFGDLPVMPGAVQVVRRLTRRYQVFVASAATEWMVSAMTAANEPRPTHNTTIRPQINVSTARTMLRMPRTR